MQKLIFCFLFVALSSPAWALDKSKVSVKKEFSLAKLQAKYRDSGSMEADVVQEVYQASLARTKTSKGTIKLSKPNFIRWETFEPEASVMVSNGRKVWYYTPDAGGKGKGQVVVRASSEITKQPLFKILTGSLALDKEFVVKSSEEKGLVGGKSTTELLLQPKKALLDIKFVRIVVSSNYLISEVNIENEAGNKSKITLQNQTLSAKLPAALFEFKPPEGTEIIKNSD